MDIAVTGLKIDERFVMISELNKLANALQDWKVLESFKAIETASIPVIKMVNPIMINHSIVRWSLKVKTIRDDRDITWRFWE